MNSKQKVEICLILNVILLTVIIDYVTPFNMFMKRYTHAIDTY